MSANQPDQSRSSESARASKDGLVARSASGGAPESESAPNPPKRQITRVDFRYAYARAALSRFDGEVLSVAEVEGYFDQVDVSGVTGALLVARKLMTPIFGDDGEVTHFKVCLGEPR